MVEWNDKRYSKALKGGSALGRSDCYGSDEKHNRHLLFSADVDMVGCSGNSDDYKTIGKDSVVVLNGGRNAPDGARI